MKLGQRKEKIKQEKKRKIVQNLIKKGAKDTCKEGGTSLIIATKLHGAQM